MPALRRPLTLLFAAVLALVPAVAASASTAADLAAAQQRLAEARAAANDARALAYQAEVALEQTQDRIAQIENTITDLEARAAELHDVVRKRALYAYTHASNNIDAVIGSEDPVTAARGQTLIDISNRKDNNAAKRLAAINTDLHDETVQLHSEESRQQAAADELAARNKDFQARVTDAQHATNALQAKLDAEIAAQREAERKAELQRQLALLLATKPVPSTTTISAGTVVANPGGGAFMCPVLGASYTDDYGGPRGHPGIDMFVPTGTQALAVKAGAVRYVPNEGAGGNTAYLDATDGNSYFYAHLSAFVGDPRTVAQGEVIGLTGMTGNATAPHLHFEIRIGGDNGSRIDPYPTLKAAGC